MIGRWQKFGEGEPPRDGEPLVWLRFNQDVLSLLEGNVGSAEFAVHRHGLLHGQHGDVIGLPFGCLWTSLPGPSAVGPIDRAMRSLDAGGF